MQALPAMNLRPARLAALAVLLLAACSKSESSGAPHVAASAPAPASVSADGVTTTDVTVDEDGFHPSSITVAKGKPARLVFTRTTDETCAKQVVFPELSLKKDLPLGEKVAIDVPTSEPRKLTFQCGMGMYKSSVVVD